MRGSLATAATGIGEIVSGITTLSGLLGSTGSSSGTGTGSLGG